MRKRLTSIIATTGAMSCSVSALVIGNSTSPTATAVLTGEPGQDGLPNGYTQAKTDFALFNLKSDIGEKENVYDQHPEIVEKLKKYAAEARDELGDSRLKMKGNGFRAPGKVVIKQ